MRNNSGYSEIDKLRSALFKLKRFFFEPFEVIENFEGQKRRLVAQRESRLLLEQIALEPKSNEVRKVFYVHPSYRECMANIDKKAS